jgi:hypothetical protein
MDGRFTLEAALPQAMAELVDIARPELLQFLR